MGEVYRATDTRLDRVVAIKVLASHLSSSPELKKRMEREARAISSLNHPNICHLYDIGSQDGADFLAMEYLEGETLAERLRKGALPLSEIYKIGIAVAEALAFAHRSGIVHRDLKPGNIMLTPGGAKLMDFGLAKPLGTQAVASGSGTAPPSFTAMPTMSGLSPLSPLTTAGSIIGTIQYMSPEQIEGKEADARSDIFAFGTVLYEMVTGKRPFSGKSQISLASSILESDPQPVSALKPSTPPAFEHVVTTCLQKNPEERFQTAHDIKLELQWIAADKSAPAVATAPFVPARVRERMGWAAGVVAAVLVGATAGMFLYHPAQTAPAIRAAINPPANATLDLVGNFAGPPVLSSDGARIAFVANSDGKNMIWVRPSNAAEAHIVAGTEGATFPFWSPDNRSLGFFAGEKLKTIDLNGGSPLAVCDAPFGRGGTWAPDGTILFAPESQSPIVRVSPSGGTPVPVTKLDTAGSSHRWPFFLPDGKHFLYLFVDASNGARDAVYYASVDGREKSKLLSSQSNAIYADGFLLFMRGGQLMAQPFDPAKGTLSGEIQNLASGVLEDASTWHMDAFAASNGLLVFSNGGTGDQQMVWLDRSGKQVGTVASKVTNLVTAKLSPQADRIALEIDNGAGNHDIWVYDMARGVQTRLTFGSVLNSSPLWSPDGKWIVYTAATARANWQAGKLYRKPSDGSGAEELLLSDDQMLTSTDWSRDSKYLLYSRGPSGQYPEIWALPLEGERKPWLVVPRSAPGSYAQDGCLSPDGHWLAYTSGESGVPEVYVATFRGGQAKWQVSTNGGSHPQWSRDGKELYYFNQATRSVVAVPVKEIGGGLQFGAAQSLASASMSNSSGFFYYDVTPDGKKILLNLVSQQVSQSVTVVTNFTVGLKR